MIWSPCCPRGSQESSPAPQFEGIHSFFIIQLSHLTHMTAIMFKTKERFLLDVTFLWLGSDTKPFSHLAWLRRVTASFLPHPEVCLGSVCEGGTRRGSWGGPGQWLFLLPADPRLFVDPKDSNWRNGVLPATEAGVVQRFLKPSNAYHPENCPLDYDRKVIPCLLFPAMDLVIGTVEHKIR